MEDLFLQAKIDNHRSICISPLPAKTYKEADAAGLGGQFGYFIYEIDASREEAGIEVIGKAASIEAALADVTRWSEPDSIAAATSIKPADVLAPLAFDAVLLQRLDDIT